MSVNGGSDSTRQTDPADSTQRIGPYHLLQMIGEGGMGEVWVAEQREPIRRTVAVKIIKLGMDSRQVVARFNAERQALAVMDHPAIAKVLDAGTTEQGRPYFVMEYVKGEPITSYCDRQRLSTAERLKLFARVCEGVQHAHQKGIIHRDLKPSNVLVTIQEGQPVPKIIDFGIAKATAHQLTEQTVFTELGVLIGTPEYMSPEQAEMTGLDIDTRTDIYSLGVLLYELLTGTMPFDRQELRAKALDEIRRTIRETDPPRPSTRITQSGPASSEAAKNRHTEPRRLASELRGDLDWITMRALEKDRTRRYDTAMGLANDVRRHLQHEPVAAGPPSAAYRARKFVRRHRFGVGSAAALIVLLVAFGLTMTVQARRIARERDRANREAVAAAQVTDFLIGLFMVSDPQNARGSSVTAREILDRGATKIAHDLDGEPLVQARLMHTIGRVYDQLGLYEQALPLTQSALDVRQKVLGHQHVEVADTLASLGTIRWHRGEFEAAHSLLERALEIRSRLDPGSVLEASSLHNLGNLHYSQGEYDAARTFLERALAIRQRADPESADVASTLNSLGAIAYKKGDLADAGRLWQRTLSIRDKVLGADHPLVAQTLNNLAVVRVDAKDIAGARPLLERAVHIQEKVLGAKHPDLASGLMNLGDLVYTMGDGTRAKPYYARALGILEAASARNPERARALERLASITLTDGNVDDAKRLYEESLTLREQVQGPTHHEVAQSLAGLAACARRQRRDKLAQSLYERSLMLSRKSEGGYFPGAADILEHYAELLEATGQKTRAREMKALAVAQRQRGDAR